MALVAYVLHLVGAVAGLTSIVGLIINYVKRDGYDEVFDSHHAWMIRSFWWAILWVRDRLHHDFHLDRLGDLVRRVGLVHLPPRARAHRVLERRADAALTLRQFLLVPLEPLADHAQHVIRLAHCRRLEPVQQREHPAEIAACAAVRARDARRASARPEQRRSSGAMNSSTRPASAVLRLARAPLAATSRSEAPEIRERRRAAAALDRAKQPPARRRNAAPAQPSNARASRRQSAARTISCRNAVAST